jgi:hypothetical protein
MGTCSYCIHFQNAKVRTYLTPTDKQLSRLCPTNSRFVKSTGSCDEFEMASMFWCKRWEHWIAPKACSIKRISEWGKEDCHKCKQGNEVSEIRKSMSDANGQKTFTKLIRRKPVVEKPTLVRRRKNADNT